MTVQEKPLTAERVKSMNNWELWTVLGIHRGELGGGRQNVTYYCIGETKAVGVKLSTGDRQVWGYGVVEKQDADNADAVREGNEELRENEREGPKEAMQLLNARTRPVLKKLDDKVKEILERTAPKPAKKIAKAAVPKLTRPILRKHA